jgi:hypothetical protein
MLKKRKVAKKMGRKTEVKEEAPVTKAKPESLEEKVVGVKEVREAVQKLIEAGKVPGILTLEGKTYNLVNRDPWFGDNGKEKRFHGCTVIGKDTDKYGFKIDEERPGPV